MCRRRDRTACERRAGIGGKQAMGAAGAVASGIRAIGELPLSDAVGNELIAAMGDRTLGPDQWD